MPKSKDAFRTISEVAEWLETPAHVLRFWESKFTQVKPVKRAGGRRYYRPADMQLLGGIKKLLHDDGLTIKGAQKLLREHGVKHVAALSQPLDDDLLDDETVVQEAAYEPDAQPEPQVEEPATVLSFPSRVEAKVEEPETVENEPIVEPDPLVGVTAEIEEPTVKNNAEEAVEENDGEDTSPDRAGDAPAFGSDALPAFLRRSPAPLAQDSEEIVEDVAEETTAADSTLPDANADKVTINPTAHYEPVEADEDDSVEDLQASTEHTPSAEPETPQPMFSRRVEADATEDESEARTESEPAKAPPSVSNEEAPASPAIDVPSIAKVAPSLDSYAAQPGVLAALPGSRGISPELAGELNAQLSELRALRDRMRNL